MSGKVLQGRRALVTGASSGLGAEFARQLAARGCHLVLVARRQDRLRALQQRIAGQRQVEVEIVPMDLAPEDAPPALYDRLKQAGQDIDVLINNAGLGVYGKFVDIPWARERELLALDIVTLVHMTRLFVQDMVARNWGFILQVASTGAYQPTPMYASYSAAKSFVLSFGEALGYELRQTNVKCTVLSPGVTATEFFQVAGQPLTLYQRLTMMKSADVARIGLEAMLQGRPSVVAGRANALMAWLTRFVPRRLAVAMAYRFMTIK